MRTTSKLTKVNWEETISGAEVQKIIFKIEHHNLKTIVFSEFSIKKIADTYYLPELNITDFSPMFEGQEAIAKYAQWLIGLGRAIKKENELNNFLNIKV